MRRTIVHCAMLLTCACAATACMPLLEPHALSPLAPTQMSAESVVLEVFFIDYRPDEPQAGDALWQEVDEQRLSHALRAQQAADGLRAGLVDVRPPQALQALLELDRATAPAGGDLAEQPVDLFGSSHVRTRRLQVRPGQRGEIVVSPLYDELPVFRRQDERLVGRTYAQAQGVFSVRAWPRGDGGIELECTPELQHGQPTQEWIPSDGGFRLQPGRPRVVFDELACRMELAPGQMLILGPRTDRPGTLGESFLTAARGSQRWPRLLLIRLAQSQRDDLFELETPQSRVDLSEAAAETAGDADDPANAETAEGADAPAPAADAAPEDAPLEHADDSAAAVELPARTSQDAPHGEALPHAVGEFASPESSAEAVVPPAAASPPALAPE